MKKKRQWFMCLGMIGVFTASVILSVFGQRKVKAQLNTENAGNYEKTVFPYVDFEEKLYIFDESKKTYTLNKSSINTPI